MAETWALLSDIHANLEALEAVLADAARLGVDRVIVLGDMINYGPDPLACVERVLESADVVLLGNHERDALVGGAGMIEVADEALRWTRGVIRGTQAWAALERLGAEGFPEACRREIDGRLLVHAAPTDPIREYVWPGNRSHHLAFNDRLDLRLRRQLDALSPHQHCVNGHTHVPAILVDYESRGLFKGAERWNRNMTFLGPTTIFFVPDGEVEIHGLDGVRALINPGSVGQPRDRDPWAGYAIYDGDSVRFRRVDYDIERTQAKLRALPLPDAIRGFLADRIARGA